MTKEEKLDIILNHKSIKNKEIAQKLDVSNSLVSQWRNKNSRKLNMLHLHALENAFNIPIEIFQSSEFDTKEKIISRLKSCCSIHSECIFKKSFPETLIGTWYCYNYNTNKQLDIDMIKIEKFKVTVYDKKNEPKLSGYPIAINDYQTLIVLSKATEPYSIHITVNNDSISNNIFYASASLKSYKNKDAVMFCLFTKERLDKLSAIEIMGDKSKNLLNISDELIENIEIFKKNRDKILNKIDSIKNILGTWYLYFKDSNSKNIIVIDNNLVVDWIKDNKPYKEGELIMDKNSIILKFPNNTYHSTYFMFIKKNTDIKLIYYIGQKYITNYNILAIGVMSKNILSQEDLNKLLPKTSSINLTKMYKQLDSFLKSNQQ